MADNIIIECDCPKWNDAGHMYDYIESVEAHYIKEFLPIRFTIMTSAVMDSLLGRHREIDDFISTQIKNHYILLFLTKLISMKSFYIQGNKF